VGWRIPFLASAVLLVVGYYIRMRIAETPVFQAALDSQQQAKVPFVELLRRQPVVLVLATLSFILAFTLSTRSPRSACPTAPPRSSSPAPPCWSRRSSRRR